jgi:hypothetical protein
MADHKDKLAVRLPGAVERRRRPSRPPRGRQGRRASPLLPRSRSPGSRHKPNRRRRSKPSRLRQRPQCHRRAVSREDHAGRAVGRRRARPSPRKLSQLRRDLRRNRHSRARHLLSRLRLQAHPRKARLLPLPRRSRCPRSSGSSVAKDSPCRPRSPPQ